MFVSEFSGNPNYYGCLQACRVSERLTQVVVICAIELVLDYDPAVRGRILAKNVGTERSDGLLLSLQFQLIDAKGLHKQL